MKLAGRLLLDEPDTFWEGSDRRVEVTDAEGLTLFWLNFTALMRRSRSPPDYGLRLILSKTR